MAEGKMQGGNLSEIKKWVDIDGKVYIKFLLFYLTVIPQVQNTIESDSHVASVS